MEKCSRSLAIKQMQVKGVKYNILSSNQKEKALKIRSVGNKAVK